MNTQFQGLMLCGIMMDSMVWINLNNLYILIFIMVCYLGLIRWGIVIHGFIDGYSRLITGLQANDNNTGQTVLDLFLRAAAIYGVPLRLRGDHGVENILVAAWMEMHRGERRGSYIWGRYMTYCSHMHY